jgi:hypothetical protein
MLKNVKEFTWSKKKLDVAKAISIGTETQRDIANQFNISEVTISRWKEYPDFLAKIDEFTLAHEHATRAGLLRECYKGLDLKRDKIEHDKNTHLHYVQEIADLKGLKKQKFEHSGSVEHTGEVVIHLPDNERKDNITEK